LKAHYQQASTLIQRNELFGEVFDEIDKLVKKHNLRERSSLSLFDAALGIRITNTRYQKDAGVSQYIDSRDLKELADCSILEPVGEKRGRYYRANDELLAALTELKARYSIKSRDPYELVTEKFKNDSEPNLPGLKV